jgi:hypothetical protein
MTSESSKKVDTGSYLPNPEDYSTEEYEAFAEVSPQDLAEFVNTMADVENAEQFRLVNHVTISPSHPVFVGGDLYRVLLPVSSDLYGSVIIEYIVLPPADDIAEGTIFVHLESLSDDTTVLERHSIYCEPEDGFKGDVTGSNARLLQFLGNAIKQNKKAMAKQGTTPS